MMLQSPAHYPTNDEDIAPLMGARQRRIGGDTPYRDDPFGDPQQVRMESFPSSEPKKSMNARQSLLNQCGSCVRGCCSNDASTLDDTLYYQDDFNDSPWSCRLGTSEEDGIWMNTADQAGTIMAMMVWLLMGYSSLTVTFLARTGGVPVHLSMLYSVLVALALASHAKTTLTDPGSIPASAVPTEEQRRYAKLNMCSQCQTFKPPFSHHCRICNRCISRMDHHCPWMNNCIGVGNMKHFVLFLIYTWICSAFSLVLLGWNYFFCSNEDCTFAPVLIQLVRIMTALGFGSFLFTSSMLMNVAYGVMTGIGTIDRLKKKATNTMHISDEEPLMWIDIFGIGPKWQWCLPVDPIFDDYDRVIAFSTPQRLLREQMKENPNQGNYPPSVISQYTPV